MQREHINTLLLRDERVSLVDKPHEADWVVCSAGEFLKHPPLHENGRYIVLCINDLYYNMGLLRMEDEDYRYHIRSIGAKFVYLKLEMKPQTLHSLGHPPGHFKMFRGDDNIMLLSLPMMLGGSKQNICYPTNDESEWYVKKLCKNPKEYEYDWCWIGSESSKDRADMIRILSGIDGMGDYILVNSEIPEKAAEMPWEEAAEITHYDNKTVPYDEYLVLARKSKVNLSGNGNGLWCPKDGEMFSRNCFVLRQWHENLNSNPLTPKDGKHWIVFKNGDLTDTLKYYVEHDAERETINDAGYEYFKQGIQGEWAAYYIDRLLQYMETEDRHDFGQLLHFDC